MKFSPVQVPKVTSSGAYITKTSKIEVNHGGAPCKASVPVQPQICNHFWQLRTELPPATGGSAMQGWVLSFRAWETPPRHIVTFLEPFWASQMVLISASICKRNHKDRSLQPVLLTYRILPEISGNVCQRHCCEFTKSKSSFPVPLGTSFPSLACRQMGPCVSFWAMEYLEVWFMPLLGQASKNLLGNPTPSFFPPSLAFQPQAVENHKV